MIHAEDSLHVRGHHILSWKNVVTALRKEGKETSIDNIIKRSFREDIAHERDTKTFCYSGNTFSGLRRFYQAKRTFMRGVLEGNRETDIVVDGEPDKICDACPVETAHCRRHGVKDDKAITIIATRSVLSNPSQTEFTHQPHPLNTALLRTTVQVPLGIIQDFVLE